MSSAASASAGGVLMVTQVHPPQTQCTPQQQTFIRAHPLALGTVQIMIGVMVLLSGIAMVTDIDSLGVFSGFFVWGAVIYITSGSLTVAAGKSLNPCLVKTSLGFNVAASIASAAGVSMCTVDATGKFLICNEVSWSYTCGLYWSRHQALSAVFAVFHLLEFAVSITVAAFACKTTCYCDNQQQVYFKPDNVTMAAHVPPTFHVTPVSMAYPPPQVVVSPIPEEQINLIEPPACT